jgi:hypothetical protein
MAYVESFFYYWLFALVGLFVIIVLLFLFIELFRMVRKVLKKSVPSFNIKKFIKFLVPIYFIAFGVLYVNKAYDYLYKDRAYKEAKAYAIAGDVIFIYKKILLGFVYPNNPLFKPLQKADDFILSKIDEYIPKSDGEREIWHYKFHSFDYARTMFAPIAKSDKLAGRSFTNPNASMDKAILPLISDIYTTIKALHEKPIKDKEFDRFDRYLAIASMAPYYAMYLGYQVNPYTDIQKHNMNYKYEMLWQEKKYSKYKNELLNFIKILDDVRKQWDKDKELAEAFEKRPNTKVAFYWGALEAYSTVSVMQTQIDHIYPCTSPLFLKEVNYYKEFVHWAYMIPKSSYKTLSKRRRKTYDFLLENREGFYYIAKYVCEIPFTYMTKDERSLDPRYREKNMRWNENYKGIKIIRKMQKDLKKQGENHGR